MGHLRVIPDEFSQAWFLLRQGPLGPQDLARFWTRAPVQGQRQLSVQLVGGHLGSERMMRCTVVCPVSLERFRKGFGSCSLSLPRIRKQLFRYNVLHQLHFDKKK